jgi:nucleotide-binding universal stress UspA family protein
MPKQQPIVICFDDSPESRHAVLEAGRMFPGTRAIALHVWKPLESTIAYRYSAAGMSGALDKQLHETDAAGQDAAEALAERGAELARQAGLDAEPHAIQAEGDLHTAVAEEVDRVDASLVVVGSRGLGALRSIALGGFSGRVVHHSHRSVLVVPRDVRVFPDANR